MHKQLPDMRLFWVWIILEVIPASPSDTWIVPPCKGCLLCIIVTCHISKCKRASKLFVIWLNLRVIGDICMGNYGLFKSTLFALLLSQFLQSQLWRNWLDWFDIWNHLELQNTFSLHNFLKLKPKQNNERNTLWKSVEFTSSKLV